MMCPFLTRGMVGVGRGLCCDGGRGGGVSMLYGGVSVWRGISGCGLDRTGWGRC